MKRNLSFGVFIILTFIFCQVSGQVIPPESIRAPRQGRTSTTPPPNTGKKAKKPKGEKGASGEATDVVALNLTSLAFSNLSIRFEHRLKGKLSFGLGAGYLLAGILPNVAPYDVVAPANEFGIQPSLGEFSGFNATPEVRFYPFSKRGAPYGFYLSLFGRYYNYDWKVPYYSSEPSTQDKITANGTFNISGIGGGMTLGAQFLIKNRLVIDWMITGGGVASSTLKGEVNSPNITDDLSFYEDIGADLETFYGDLPGINSNNLMINIEKEKANFELGGQLLPIIRLGFGIGWAF